MIKRLLGILCAILVLLTTAGCKGKGAVRQSAALAVDGRQIKASVEGAGVFIHPDGDAAVVRFRGHKARVEKNRVVVDNGTSATISSDATLVEIVVTKANALTISADGVKVLAAKLK